MLKAIQGDITQLAVDAIVNAANEQMLGGSGVDGAIHRGAGEELFEYCLAMPEVSPRVRCPKGEARITPGFNLAAKFVIHTVGPIWNGGGYGEENILRNCYRNSIELALENDVKTIAFPAISCGIYGYPIQAACEASIDELKKLLSAETNEIEVTLVAFDEGMFDVMTSLLTD